MPVCGRDCGRLVLAETGGSEQIRIVSWNLANLAEGPGIDLRGYTRSQEDFDQLRFVVSKLEPDIVALQELGSAPLPKQSWAMRTRAISRRAASRIPSGAERMSMKSTMPLPIGKTLRVSWERSRSIP